MMVELEARRSKAPYDLLGYLPVPHPVPHYARFQLVTSSGQGLLFRNVDFEIKPFADPGRRHTLVSYAVVVEPEQERWLPRCMGYRYP